MERVTYGPCFGVWKCDNEMERVRCSCGWGGSLGGPAHAFIDHVRGKHGIDVKAGHSHWAHCNEATCERSNGHGRRIPNLGALLQHLEQRHGLDADVANEDD